jgi:hypothetical protein
MTGVRLGHQHVHVPPRELLDGVTEHSATRRVDAQNRASSIDEDDRVLARFDELLQALGRTFRARSRR